MVTCIGIVRVLSVFSGYIYIPILGAELLSDGFIFMSIDDVLMCFFSCFVYGITILVLSNIGFN